MAQHDHHHAHDHANHTAESSGDNHQHDIGHGHNHDVSDAGPNFGPAFALGTALNVSFVAIEAAYGLFSHSLALVADAGHNLGDTLGLLLAWGASLLVQRRPSLRRTYGFKRSSILASVVNAVVMLVTVGGIAVEAIRRFFEPGQIATGPVIVVATIGVVINGLTALAFQRSGIAHGHGGGDHHGHAHTNDLNIRSVIVHMVVDTLVSVGVIITAIIIGMTGLQWLDPAAGLVIAVIILFGTWSLLRQSMNLVMDAVPEGIDPSEVQIYLAELPGVIEVHDLHIWGMSTTENALTVHLIRPDRKFDDALLAEAACVLKDRFGIHHATFQVEQGDVAYPCRLAPAEVV